MCCSRGFVRCEFLVVLCVDPLVLVLRTSSILAFVLLHAVLLIGPWARFLKKGWLVLYRRHLGVAVFFLAWFHSTVVISKYFAGSPTAGFSNAFVFFGQSALFILFLLAVTSWDRFQNGGSSRWWSVFHTGTLIVYLLLVRLFVVSSLFPIPSWSWWVVGFVVAFWVLSAPWALPKWQFSFVRGWKQVHVLIYPAYVLILFHSWVIIQQYNLGAPLIIVFWILPVVTGSHVAGWVVAWRKRRSIE